MATVVYSSAFVPAEWILAHGLRPSRVLPQPVGARPEIGLRTGMCPYLHAFINAVCAGPQADAVVVTTTCDQMRRGSELIQRRCDVPVFLMNVPATWQTVTAQRRYVEELRRLGRFLVRLGGRTPSGEELAGAMRELDDKRSTLRSARGCLSPRQYSEALAEFQRTATLSVENSDPPFVPRGVGVALLGGPLLADDFGIFDLVEQAGGCVVLDATESGELSLPEAFDRRRLYDDPLGELADAYFGRMPGVFRRPNRELYRWLKHRLPERGARGIILRRYVWCDMWHAEAGRLREWKLLPVVDIQVGEGQQAATALGRRVQAFVEMLR